MVTLTPLKDFSHLQDLVGMKLAYHVNQFNCEHFASRCRYGVGYSGQQMTQFQKTLYMIMATFAPWGPEQQKAIRPPVDEIVVPESSIDVTGLKTMQHVSDNNVVYFHSDPDSTNVVVRGLGVKGKYVITVAHIKRENYTIGRYINGEYRKFNARRVVSDTERDISVFEVTDRTMPAFKDIVDKFIPINTLCNTLVKDRQIPGILTIGTPSKAQTFMNYTIGLKPEIEKIATKSSDFATSDGLRYTSYLTGVVGLTGYTQPGDCGSFITMLDPQVTQKVLGIHRAGSDQFMYMVVLSQEDVKYYLKEATATINNQAREICLSEEDGVREWHGDTICQKTGHEIVAKSVYNSVPRGGTKIRRTIFKTDILGDPGEPSITSSTDPRNPNFDALALVLQKYHQPEVTIDRYEVRYAFSEISEWLCNKINYPVRKLTTEEAINGPSKKEFRTSQPMNRNTSPGYPQSPRDNTTTKGAYLVQVGEEGHEHWQIAKTENGDRLTRDVTRLLCTAGNGHRNVQPFSCFLKDEILNKKKIYGVGRKTRGIMGGNFAITLTFRRYFLAAVLRIQELYQTIPIKVGIDAIPDWHQLTMWHLEVGDVGFDADAANWDATVPLIFMEEVVEVFNAIYRAHDRTGDVEKECEMRSSLHSNVEGVLVYAYNRILKLKQGQVSGQPNTTIENSLINWCLVYCCYRRLAKLNAPSKASFSKFMELTRLSVFGDDMMVTIDESIAVWFNLKTYAATAKEFGFDITDSGKGLEEVKSLKRITEMQFLKRSFVKISDHWVGPIALPTISKQLHWIKGQGRYVPTVNACGDFEFRSVVDLGAMKNVAQEVLIEVGLHGRELYQRVAKELTRQLHDATGSGIDSTYSSVMQRVGLEQRIELDRAIEGVPQCQRFALGLCRSKKCNYAHYGQLLPTKQQQREVNEAQIEILNEVENESSTTSKYSTNGQCIVSSSKRIRGTRNRKRGSGKGQGDRPHDRESRN
jgi:Zn/Cd-binding protein ZinT